MKTLVVDTSGKHAYLANENSVYCGGGIAKQGSQVKDHWAAVEDVDLALFTGEDPDAVDFLRERGLPVMGACSDVVATLKHTSKLGIPFGVFDDDALKVGVTAFYDGSRFLTPYCIFSKATKLLDGDLGPETPATGVTAVMTSRRTVFSEMLEPLAITLKDRHRGAVNIHCAYNQGNVLAYNVNTGFDFPGMAGMLMLVHDDREKLFHQIASGKADELGANEDTWVIGVCINTHNYPWTSEVKAEPVKISGMADAAEDYCKMVVVASDLTNPSVGNVVVSYGLGDTITTARDDAYRILDYIQFPGLSCRLDIGKRVGNNLSDLQMHRVFPKGLKA